MISPIELVQRHPEYVHVVINHVPIEGLMFAALGLFFAVCAKSRAARVVALLLVLLSAASVYPVYELGEAGYDLMQDKVDDDGEAWLDEHLERAKLAIFIYYAVAALAAVSLVFEKKSSELAPKFAVLVLAGCGAAIGAGGWVAYAGGKAVHHEFRFEGPPPAQSSSPHDGAAKESSAKQSDSDATSAGT